MRFPRLLGHVPGALLLTSCTVFSPYHNTADYWYHHSLSKQEKAEVVARGQLLKNWVGTNAKGDTVRGPLLVGQDSRGRFVFTELGTWQYRYQGAAAKGWRAAVLDSIVHDDYGNIRYRAERLDENQDSTGRYLFEQWTSTQTDSLRQVVTSYYPNGQIRFRQHITVVNPDELVKDYAKQKQLTGMEAYDEAGQPISAQQVEKLLYVWYMPHISMKKQQ